MAQTAKKDEGILLVVSGPSGAGKGTICNAIREKFPDLQYSVSMTTRDPRKGEVEGESYFFRTNEQFEKLIEEDAFLEYAKVYDHYYGTPKKRALDMISDGKSVLLEIDIQGAMQVKNAIRKASSSTSSHRLWRSCPIVSTDAVQTLKRPSKSASHRSPVSSLWHTSMTISSSMTNSKMQ